jgi:hypothetical protein
MQRGPPHQTLLADVHVFVIVRACGPLRAALEGLHDLLFFVCRPDVALAHLNRVDLPGRRAQLLDFAVYPAAYETDRSAQQVRCAPRLAVEATLGRGRKVEV